MGRLPGSTPEEKLRLNHRVDPTSGCWRWTGAHTASGYGHLWVEGKAVAVHRLAYGLWVGPIPDGLEVDHVKTRGCVYRDCIRPDHLEPVTHYENVQRGAWGQRERCKNGHLYAEHGASHPPGSSWKGRWCRACHRDRSAERRARAKEAPRG